MSNDFRADLETLLIQHSSVCRTNTPRYILARVMFDALQSFESHLFARASYFRQSTGIEDYPHDHQD